MSVKNTACAILMLLAPTLSLACDDAINAVNATIPITPGEVAAAYPIFTSKADDVLLSASSPCCKAVELHTHTMEGGVMQMRQVERIPLSAGIPTVFNQGGLHLMFIGFKKPLTAGSKVPVTFTFEHAGKHSVNFTAVAPGLHPAADSPKHHHE